MTRIATRIPRPLYARAAVIFRALAQHRLGKTAVSDRDAVEAAIFWACENFKENP